MKQGTTQGFFCNIRYFNLFMEYSGTTERFDADFAAQIDKYGKPKVSLINVPQLVNVLKGSASQIDKF